MCVCVCVCVLSGPFFFVWGLEGSLLYRGAIYSTHCVCFFLKCFFCIIEVLRVHCRETDHFHDEFQCPVDSCALRSLDVAEKSFAKSEPKGMMADDGWL